MEESARDNLIKSSGVIKHHKEQLFLDSESGKV
jgi:hypothetical protein